MVLDTRKDRESSRGIGMRLLVPRLNNRNLIFFGSPEPALASAKAAAGKSTLEEHCSETLLRSSPILQTLITNYYTYTHIQTYIKICIHLPTPDPSPHVMLYFSSIPCLPVLSIPLSYMLCMYGQVDGSTFHF